MFAAVVASLFVTSTNTGLPYIRLIPKVTAVSGETLHLKCPVAGYPIEEIHWERGMYPLCLCVCCSCMYHHYHY